VAVEIGVGLALAFIAALIRYSLTPLVGGIAPYAFVFAAVTIAAVAAGWRSGLLALVVGQALVWFAILEPLRNAGIGDGGRIGGLIISSLSQLILLLAIGLYQHEVDKGAAEREQRVALLDEALREIDHRTRNNYQTVLALVELQARRATDDHVREALQQVSDRIEAVANASQQLALHSAGLDIVRLDKHLCGLIGEIERGLSREEIQVECKIDDVTAGTDAATSISIIVNELVTNALKHAFNGEASGHVWVTGKAGSAFELIVADDGHGFRSMRHDGPSGLGTRLVESFARQLGAAHEVVSTEQGTTHRLLIPSLD
jgi:two-component system, sensor histidine kinase PdtaS